MYKFYGALWLDWAYRMVLKSLVSGAVLATLVTAIVYITRGSAPLSSEVFGALLRVWSYSFAILLGLTTLLFLFRELKGIFNTPYHGYRLELLSCHKDQKSVSIESVGYGDILPVWRKWFMLLIWIVASFLLLLSLGSYLLLAQESLFFWFNIYVVYGLILLSGYFSFMVLSARCKCTRVVKC